MVGPELREFVYGYMHRKMPEPYRRKTIYAPVRDVSKQDINYQLERLTHSRDRIGRRLVKAAKRSDMLRVRKLSMLLADTEGRIGQLHARMVLIRDELEGAG
jgi:hypothetical protein